MLLGYARVASRYLVEADARSPSPYANQLDVIADVRMMAASGRRDAGKMWSESLFPVTKSPGACSAREMF